MTTQQDVGHVLEGVAAGTAAAAAFIPPPGDVITAAIAAAVGAIGRGLEAGKTPEETLAAIHRIHRIDTSASDAEVDALVAAKPSSAPAHIELAHQLAGADPGTVAAAIAQLPVPHAAAIVDGVRRARLGTAMLEEQADTAKCGSCGGKVTHTPAASVGAQAEVACPTCNWQVRWVPAAPAPVVPGEERGES